MFPMVWIPLAAMNTNPGLFKLFSYVPGGLGLRASTPQTVNSHKRLRWNNKQFSNFSDSQNPSFTVFFSSSFHSCVRLILIIFFALLSKLWCTLNSMFCIQIFFSILSNFLFMLSYYNTRSLNINILFGIILKFGLE